MLWGACSRSDSPAAIAPGSAGSGGGGGDSRRGGASGLAGGGGGVGPGGGGVGGAAGGGLAGHDGGSDYADAGPDDETGRGADAKDVGATAGNAANVLEYHKSPTRDGVYVDAAFTRAAAATMHMDASFKVTILGPTYAQPLYFEGGPAGKNIIITTTEQNQVSAFDAVSGAVVWQKSVGTPVAKAMMPCGNIDPFGITGTPVIDAPSRTLFFDAMTTAAGGRHFIFALSLDDGSTRTGWPIDVSAALAANQQTFASNYQSQRGALALVDGTLYVPYGGLWGDCGTYYGWVVAVPIGNPSAVRAFATNAAKSGIWGLGGIASDGTSLWVTTGNAPPGSAWGGQEAVLRLTAGAVFSGVPGDFFRPSNWQALDDGDLDLGGSGPVLVDVPGATPPKLAVLLGKNGVAYLVDRTNLGGTGAGDGVIGEGIDSSMVSSTQIVQGAAAYAAGGRTYVALRGTGMGAGCTGELIAIGISAASPPKISPAWCASQGGSGSPIVTTTDGTSEAIVWGLGTGTGRLMGFDGQTGRVIFGGGTAADQMQSIQGFQTAIAARGRIYVAANNDVYAFIMQ